MNHTNKKALYFCNDSAPILTHFAHHRYNFKGVHHDVCTEQDVNKAIESTLIIMFNYFSTTSPNVSSHKYNPVSISSYIFTSRYLL